MTAVAIPIPPSQQQSQTGRGGDRPHRRQSVNSVGASSPFSSMSSHKMHLGVSVSPRAGGALHHHSSPQSSLRDGGNNSAGLDTTASGHSSNSHKFQRGPSLPPTPPANSIESDQGMLVPGSTKPVLPPAYNLPANHGSGGAAGMNDVLPPIHTGSFIDNFRDALNDIDLDECEAHGENAFFVCDLAEVYRQHMRWMKELGFRVQPFFAVKSNPDPYVLQLMASLGLGFDCASQPEISAVLALPHQPDPSRIIYANPCKAASFIRHASKHGVDYMTFDNGDELAKIKKYHPRAKMVLRILTDDSSSLCRLGLKFGAPLSEVRGLLKKAKALEINVVGVSFHCGSGCKDPGLFGDAIRRARWAFDVGAEAGFDFNLLDIGGGFEDDNFEAIASVLRTAIDQHFPVASGIRIIAEPGRYYVSRAFQLATNIIARRAAREGVNDESSMVEEFVEEPSKTLGAAAVEGAEGEVEEEAKPAVMYYINDGVYGAFNCTLFDHQVVHPVVMTLGESFQSTSDMATIVSEAGPLEECSVWGPTCDSIDVVQPRAQLPVQTLSVGDWLRWENMGAYTICAASQFNGFRKSTVRYTIDELDPAVEGKIRELARGAAVAGQS